MIGKPNSYYGPGLCCIVVLHKGNKKTPKDSSPDHKHLFWMVLNYKSYLSNICFVQTANFLKPNACWNISSNNIANGTILSLEQIASWILAISCFVWLLYCFPVWCSVEACFQIAPINLAIVVHSKQKDFAILNNCIGNITSWIQIDRNWRNSASL